MSRFDSQQKMSEILKDTYTQHTVAEDVVAILTDQELLLEFVNEDGEVTRNGNDTLRRVFLTPTNAEYIIEQYRMRTGEDVDESIIEDLPWN